MSPVHAVIERVADETIGASLVVHDLGSFNTRTGAFDDSVAVVATDRPRVRASSRQNPIGCHSVQGPRSDRLRPLDRAPSIRFGCDPDRGHLDRLGVAIVPAGDRE